MRKRGSIHVDWVISMGIFLVYIIVLLILIKPSYKSNYEGDALTKMIKDEFLIQNKIDAGFVVFKTKGCEKEEPVDIKSILATKLLVTSDNIYIKAIGGTEYKAYFLEGSDVSSDEFLNCLKDIGEVVYYNGLKQNLDFNEDNKDTHNVAFSKKFPSSRKYKITIYQGGKGTEISPRNDNGVVSMGEPSSDDKVYVLDWSSAKLKWDSAAKEIKRGYEEDEIIKEGNIIINIRVW